MGTGGLSRRQFLGATGFAATGLVVPRWSAHAWSAERAAALDAVLRHAARPDGTTLVSSLERAPGSGYVSLRETAGWPTLPREDLSVLKPDRSTKRVALASVVHLTDVHIIDAQSPGRVEYLDDVNAVFSAAFRPQELLTTQVQASMTKRIRDLRVGPISGRRFDCAVSTGDNIDNQQHNELDWFIGVLDGGKVRPDSGSPTDYEGVQRSDWVDERYWHPEQSGADRYSAAGFPRIDGFLAAAVAEFTSPGLDIPWYSTYGNHDGLLQGNLPRTDAIDAALVGDLKVTGSTSSNPIGLIAAFAGDTASIPQRVASGELTGRTVTADAKRRTVTTAEWVQAHLASGASGGPGPVGHGYDESHLDGKALYYRFEIAPGVTGLSLDTGGYNAGSIGESQLQWLEHELQSVHSLYFSPDGREICRACDDHLVVIFSHFTSGTMTGSADPTRPDERRVQGPELTATLLRYPNVVAWVNGHTHSNSITPVPDPQHRGGGFWEITTASHVDFPEQARILEIVDNTDGTMSIFTTMIEHAAPATADYGNLTAAGLAAISRELSANNSVEDIARHVGETRSLNCELALTAPFPLKDLHAAASTSTTASERAASSAARTSSSSSTPVGPIALGVGAAAVVAGGAIALRRRGAQDAGAAEADSGSAES
ncbi:MAG: TIGR03767 family metallophosphoesterase [Acidimicrobiales bacterium]